VREHGKLVRTPLAAFFNRPTMEANKRKPGTQIAGGQALQKIQRRFRLYSTTLRRDNSLLHGRI